MRLVNVIKWCFWHLVALRVKRTLGIYSLFEFSLHYKFVLYAYNLHVKQVNNCSHTENNGECQDPPEVSRKLTAGILTNWLNYILNVSGSHDSVIQCSEFCLQARDVLRLRGECSSVLLSEVEEQ